MSKLSVYVPVPGTAPARMILDKSGIVGSPVDDLLLRIDYEGNRYGSVSMVTFADRVLHAADRHTWNDGRGYPTVARMTVRAEEVQFVGTWHPDEGRVQLHDAEGQVALARWLGVDLLDGDAMAEQLRTSNERRV